MGPDVDHVVAEQRGEHRLHYLPWCVLSDPAEHRLLWNVILPGSLPHIFTGLAVGMGVAWVSLIAAEMISGQFGVGYFTWEAYSLVDYPAIVLGMITIGVLGLGSSAAIRGIGRVVMPWAKT